MALVKCKECGKKVSTEASSCPSCGLPNPTSKKKSTSFIKSFWNGEWSLLQTFWGYFIVGNTILGAPIVMIVDVSDNFFSDLGWFLFGIYTLAYMVFYVWTCVGTWKCSTIYTIRKKKVWGKAAKVIVFLSIAGNIFVAFYG